MVVDATTDRWRRILARRLIDHVEINALRSMLPGIGSSERHLRGAELTLKFCEETVFDVQVAALGTTRNWVHKHLHCMQREPRLKKCICLIT
jgi:hypothetical protein